MDSDDISSMFRIESDKLENLVNNATNSELSISEIIETYYQIMNVSSMSIMLKQKFGGSNEHQPLLDKITDIKKVISEKFNSDIHPQIMEKLAKSIQETMQNLQFKNLEQKSKEDTENESKLYEELREKMSTKEFVEQYDKGLSYD